MYKNTNAIFKICFPNVTYFASSIFTCYVATSHKYTHRYELYNSILETTYLNFRSSTLNNRTLCWKERKIVRKRRNYTRNHTKKVKIIIRSHLNFPLPIISRYVLWICNPLKIYIVENNLGSIYLLSSKLILIKQT